MVDLDTVFVMKVKDVKKKKKTVHTLKPYEQRNYFLLLVSPRLIEYLLYLFKRNYKSTPELLYSVEIFF